MGTPQASYCGGKNDNEQFTVGHNHRKAGGEWAHIFWPACRPRCGDAQNRGSGKRDTTMFLSLGGQQLAGVQLSSAIRETPDKHVSMLNICTLWTVLLRAKYRVKNWHDKIN